MPAFDVANRIRDALEDIKSADLDDPRLMEVLSLAENLVEAMKMFFGSMDHSVLGEFKHIATYINRTREEIAALRPNDIHNSRIPTAGAELEAVVGDTERATHLIMEKAEEVMAMDYADPDACKAQVDDAMMEIIQACSFQDITGQRVSKVVSTLTHIEERVSRFAEVMGVLDAEEELTDKEKWQQENLLNGPQLNGPATGQDAIDALFDGDGDETQMGQDDIDSLFD